MNKKAITSNMINIFAFLIIIAAIAFVGANIVSRMQSDAKNALLVEFESKIQENADRAAGSSGIEFIEGISLPEGVTEFYIFDKANDFTGVNFGEVSLINDSISSDVKENAFVYFKDGRVISFKVDNVLMAEPYYACVEENNGKIDLSFSNYFGSASVTAADNKTDCTISEEMRDIADDLSIDVEEDMEFDDAISIIKDSARNDISGVDVAVSSNYNSVMDKTNVNFAITNSNTQVRRLMLASLIPKCALASANPGSFSTTGTPSRTRIIRKDPLVMWKFDNVGSLSSDISFEKDGKIDEVCAELLKNFIVITDRRAGKIKRALYARDSDYDKDGIKNSVDIYPADYDNDGFPDSWEREYGYPIENTIPRLPIPNDDDDGDGIINIREYDLDKNPKVPDNT